MRFIKNVVLSQEQAFQSYYDDASNIKILTIKCPRCEMCYRIPLVTGSDSKNDKIPMYCPYCKKKLITRRKLK